MDTLLLLSGGIDSAWCLRQRVLAGLPTRTHHIVLKDHEGRASVESAATKRVLSWMYANGGANLIQHTESTVDFGSLRWIPQNFYLWAYWAGTIMAAPSGKGITKVILPRHSDAFAGGPAGPGALKSDLVYKTTIELMAQRSPQLLFPMSHLTKAEVIADMPDDLLQACWWCRRPRYGKPCHKCQTCQQVDPAITGRRAV